MATGTLRPRLQVGWREWVSLPELGVDRIKAKVDTGARTSALHATHIRRHQRDDGSYLHFLVHPSQRGHTGVVQVAARLIDERQVRSSNGHQELRPVILTELKLGAYSWPIELTLTNRQMMGFRLLLGRQALRRRVMIDPGRSFVAARATPRTPHFKPRP
ncbi:MAG: ATP-dependent zinc protease [Polyangiales bacterium]